MKLTITCSCGEVRAKLNNRQSRLSGGLAELHKALGLELLSLIRMNMEQETAPDGTPWTPLAPATIKRRRGQAHPILRRTGDLYRSITVRADAEKAAVGTNWPYARIHQLGGAIQRTGGTVRLHFKKFKSGKRKGLVRFSKANAASYGMKAAVGPYTIPVPARPYLFSSDGSIPDHWHTALENIVKTYLGRGHA